MNWTEIDRTKVVAAVVQAADGVRFVAVGVCGDQVAEPLVDYVRQRCDHVLWPRAASRVRALIEAGETYAAIAEYFDHVGSRWDEERLQVHVIARVDDPAWSTPPTGSRSDPARAAQRTPPQSSTRRSGSRPYPRRYSD